MPVVIYTVAMYLLQMCQHLKQIWHQLAQHMLGISGTKHDHYLCFPLVQSC